MRRRTCSEETRKKISLTKTLNETSASRGDKHYLYGKSRSLETRAKLSQSCPSRISILITDLEKNSATEYSSIKEAARQLGISRSTVSRYLETKLPYKKRYLFTVSDS